MVSRGNHFNQSLFISSTQRIPEIFKSNSLYPVSLQFMEWRLTCNEFSQYWLKLAFKISLYYLQLIESYFKHWRTIIKIIIIIQ